MKQKSIIEEWYGVKPLIPLGYPWLSPTSGARLSQEVLDAMYDAGKYKVDLRELLLRAGEEVARIIDTEAAYITSGGSAALTLAAAAVMTGRDLAKMRQLPNTDYPASLPNEFIVQTGSLALMSLHLGWPAEKLSGLAVEHPRRVKYLMPRK